MTTQIHPVLTVADLDLLPDDGNLYEIIEGELLVSRAPSVPHQLVITNLITLIRIYLHGNPIGVIIPGPGVIFDDTNAVIPDIVFLTNERRSEIASGDRVTGAPELIIEILSSGAENARRDRVVKRQLYGRFGVREYWIVDPAKREVELYEFNEQTLVLVATYRGQDEITSSVLPTFRCKVESVFEM